MPDSPNIEAPYLVEGQASPEVTHNDAVNLLDGLGNLFIVENRTRTSPPASPNDGEAWEVQATASGAWTGKEGDIAFYYDGWIFVTPRNGQLMSDLNLNRLYYLKSGTWTQIAAP